MITHHNAKRRTSRNCVAICLAALVTIGTAASQAQHLSNQAQWTFPINATSLSLDMTLAEVKNRFPDAKQETDTAIEEHRAGYVTLLQNGIPDGRFWFVFRKERLIEVRLDSGTEGATAAQAALEAQVVHDHGKGRRSSNGRVWSFAGVTVTKFCSSEPETGDAWCSLTIESSGSAEPRSPKAR